MLYLDVRSKSIGTDPGKGGYGVVLYLDVRSKSIGTDPGKGGYGVD